ncbi:hypothetical protein E3U55_03025 [Filobacillus milosensis]|uniref:Endolytic transglycosylase MltG n=1 Tax=Filobacillus milosensis TaxID=94137 RepID=A0A4Y8ISW6_9BACI|nr:endolytic transglycosylase MltG [Filobacillus milosensis]TFB23801.1 hypothetical protein E3U55_03025 [Filobacillus milosensis]
MRTVVQSFSIGIITAALIIGIFYMLEEEETVQSESTLSTQEAKEYLKDEGFAVVSSSEYDEILREKQQLENEIAQIKEEQSKKEDEDNKEKSETEQNTEENNESNAGTQNDEEKETEDNNKSFTLNIQSGMTSIDIANELETAQIIDNADEFNNYLEQNNYSRQIQLGEYQLNNSMSFNEIADVITN